MSGQQPVDRLKRATIFLPLRAGQPLGRQREVAYLTPRFPDGITAEELKTSNVAIQRETMVVWFLANFRPADGPYFGFGEAQSPSGPNPLQPAPYGSGAYGPGNSPNAYTGATGSGPTNTFATNARTRGRGVEVVGFGQGSWLQGGRAPDLLNAEFSIFVGPDTIAEAAANFDDLWEWKPPLKTSASDEARAALADELEAYEAAVKAVEPAPAGIGHNGGPGSQITKQEKATLLTAVASMRLTVSSGGDASVLNAVWSGVSSIASHLAAWTLGQIDVFFVNFTPVAGKSLGEKWPVILLGLVSLWLGQLTISQLISALLPLK
jgi:hypothetical protein